MKNWKIFPVADHLCRHFSPLIFPRKTFNQTLTRFLRNWPDKGDNELKKAEEKSDSYLKRDDTDVELDQKFFIHFLFMFAGIVHASANCDPTSGHGKCWQ